MTTFYMLVGLPGSGKSSLADEIKKEAENTGKHVEWVSSDNIRKDFYGSEEIQGDSKRVFEEMYKRTKDALKEGYDVIYDACNNNRKKRKALLNRLCTERDLRGLDVEKICLICATPYETCVQRDRQRKRTVEESVIKDKFYLYWNTPHYFEGWDKIDIHFAENSKGIYGSPNGFVQKYMDYNQDNPHHLETLGEHLTQTMEYLKKNGKCNEEDNLAIAGLLHACGKPFTKAFSDRNGNATEIAHYYQHDCAGAYDAMFFEYPNKSKDDILDISLLINLHMDPMSWGEHTKEKREKEWGTQIYEAVMMLHEADHMARRF